MKNVIIFLGYNSNNLFGANNDIRYIKNTINTNNYNHIETITLEYENTTLKNIINSINTFNEINNLIIYFSGNGTNNGKIEIYNDKISHKDIFKNINVKINKLIYILDCCYSENFIKKNTCNNINEISLLSSCSKNQTSKEVLMKINDTYKVMGIFTYYLCKIINYKKLYDFNSWDKIKNNNIWCVIDKKFNQTFLYKNFF